MGSQNEYYEGEYDSLQVSIQKRVKMTLLKGLPWGQENDSFKGVKMTLLN